MIELVYKYKVDSEKASVTSKTDILKSSSHEADGFFSPLPGSEESPTPQGTLTQAPVTHNEYIHLLEVNSSNIDLTIFTAFIDVRVDKKMAGELLRATKKDPPSRLRYELIFVSFTVVKHFPKIGPYSCSDGEGRVWLKRQGGRGIGIYRERVSRVSG